MTRFYVEWLGFGIDWEVEAGPGGPKYVQVSLEALHVAPWNAKVMEVIDPFGNRLCFNQPLAASRG
jgi:hypothetical protein